MGTLFVLSGGVYLLRRLVAIGGLIAMGLHASEWSERQQLARAAMDEHDYNTAARFFAECLPLSGNEGERVKALTSYGIVLGRAERHREARQVLEQALAGGGDKFVISGALASTDRSLGDYQSAERILRAAIADTSGSSGERATLMVSLADLLREESRGEEAGTLLDAADRLPELPREQQIGILVERAELNRDMHQWAASVADWNKVGETARAEHSMQLEEVYAGGLGETWLAAGDLARAEPLLRRSLSLLRADRSVSSTQIATALALMARVYTMQDKLALAAESLDEAVSRKEAVLGRSHPQVAMLLEMRAAILSRRGEAQSARDDLSRARDIMTTHFGAESTAIAGVDAVLGEVEDRANRPAVAAAQYGSALRLLKSAGLEGAWFGAVLMNRYAAALKAANRKDEAKAVLAFTRNAEAR